MRQRLTTRTADDFTKPQYPGSVNQPDREEPAFDEYDTYEQTVNHELPDKRTEWKDNPRDDIGFGIPKQARIYAAAHKAVKLATLLLGDQVKVGMIEAQARDFMRLGEARIDRTLKRFADTEAATATVTAAPAVAATASPATTTVTASAPVAAPVAQAPVAAEAAPVAAQAAPVASAPVAPVASAPVAAPVTATAAPVAAPVAPVAAPVAAQAPVAAPAVASAPVASIGAACAAQVAAAQAAQAAPVAAEQAPVSAASGEACDISFDETPSTDADFFGQALEGEVEPDAEIASIFADDDADAIGDTELPVPAKPATASKKAAKVGAKTLGGQPRVASVQAPDDLSGLWKSVPDVSATFG